MARSYAPTPRFTPHCVLAVRGEPANVAAARVTNRRLISGRRLAGGDPATARFGRQSGERQCGDYRSWSFFEFWVAPTATAEIAVPADAAFRSVFLFHGSAFPSRASEQYRPDEVGRETSRPSMIVSSRHLIGSEADVTVTVWIGAVRVTDVVDAALVIGARHLDFSLQSRRCNET